MLDVEPELKGAWKAIIEAGGKEKVPQAYEAFNRMIISYAECNKVAQLLYPSSNNSMIDIIKLRQSWSEKAAANFLEAKKLALEGK